MNFLIFSVTCFQCQNPCCLTVLSVIPIFVYLISSCCKWGNGDRWKMVYIVEIWIYELISCGEEKKINIYLKLSRTNLPSSPFLSAYLNLMRLNSPWVLSCIARFSQLVYTQSNQKTCKNMQMTQKHFKMGCQGSSVNILYTIDSGVYLCLCC